MELYNCEKTYFDEMKILITKVLCTLLRQYVEIDKCQMWKIVLRNQEVSGAALGWLEASDLFYLYVFLWFF